MDTKDIKKGLEAVTPSRAQNQKIKYIVTKLPRGDYAAQVEASDVVRFGPRKNSANLLLLTTCRNKYGLYKTTLVFCICQPDMELQYRERVALQSLAGAMGVFAFCDSDQLHGKTFRLTVWREKPMMFTCRPVALRNE